MDGRCSTISKLLDLGRTRRVQVGTRLRGTACAGRRRGTARSWAAEAGGPRHGGGDGPDGWDGGAGALVEDPGLELLQDRDQPTVHGLGKGDSGLAPKGRAAGTSACRAGPPKNASRHAARAASTYGETRTARASARKRCRRAPSGLWTRWEQDTGRSSAHVQHCSTAALQHRSTAASCAQCVLPPHGPAHSNTVSARWPARLAAATANTRTSRRCSAKEKAGAMRT